ncbi:MAG: hypothetical protein ACYTGS_13150, partial [Planctomycetota bacterium]
WWSKEKKKTILVKTLYSFLCGKLSNVGFSSNNLENRNPNNDCTTSGSRVVSASDVEFRWAGMTVNRESMFMLLSRKVKK